MEGSSKITLPRISGSLSNYYAYWQGLRFKPLLTSQAILILPPAMCEEDLRH